jgi:hypothetical protein
MAGLDFRARSCSVALASLIAACMPTYYVVRSTPLPQAQEAPAGAPVTPGTLPDLKRLALVPWDACASSAAAERQACASGIRALEAALLARGFEVVAWQALREQRTHHNQTSAEAAQALNVPYLLRVQAPEAQESAPQLRFQRSYHASDEAGALGAHVELAARDADRLDVIAGRAEQEAPFAVTSVESIQLSLERTSGELVWLHRESVIAHAPRPHVLTLHVRCQEGSCASAQRGDTESQRPGRATSERLLLPAHAPEPLLARVATALAARLAELATAAPGG